MIGAVEALISLLIVFGDRLGGVLLFGYLLVFSVATYGNTILSAIAKQKFTDLMPLLPQVFHILYTLADFTSEFDRIFFSLYVRKKSQKSTNGSMICIVVQILAYSLYLIHISFYIILRIKIESKNSIIY